MNTTYTLIRSRRKTLALQIAKDLSLVVRAPLRLPRREIDRFVAMHQDWIATHRERQRRHNDANPPLTAAETAALEERARAVIPGRVRHFSALMGLLPAAVKITRAKTRFGSCSGKNSLCFSCFLMGYPPEAVDYVVVHELAHIAHKNHGPAFYALIESILPDYRARRALLRRQ